MPPTSRLCDGTVSSKIVFQYGITKSIYRCPSTHAEATTLVRANFGVAQDQIIEFFVDTSVFEEGSDIGLVSLTKDSWDLLLECTGINIVTVRTRPSVASDREEGPQVDSSSLKPGARPLIERSDGWPSDFASSFPSSAPLELDESMNVNIELQRQLLGCRAEEITSCKTSTTSSSQDGGEVSEPQRDLVLSPQPDEHAPVGEWFVERSKYIPLRLTLTERKYFRLLEAALTVSEYTDKIDVLSYNVSKAKRIVHQIKELCTLLSGLVLAADYKQGQELFADRDFASNSDFYQSIFELGRRHKIMNPDKMRETYGKLMYVLMDAQIPEIGDTLGFKCVAPLRTVYTVLEAAGALDMLRDPRIAIAAKEIISEPGSSRRNIDKSIKSKEWAIEQLSTEYAAKGLSTEKLRQCIYSIVDNDAFLRVNRDPCEKMIGYLKQYFTSSKPADGRSLAIRSGKGGARLSHDHSTQYAYVIQSLTLWREILNDFFHLWSLAEQDLMSSNTIYRLRDTGKGLNRVQPAPKTSRAIHAILDRAQRSIGSWVGSPVIHMGDYNVPNALMFIDKYSQIYRILLPICNTLSQLPLLMEKPALKQYINAEFGSLDGAFVAILGDFFRSGFDGSGVDNCLDAESSVDDPLKSAWNWYSNIEEKKFSQLFLLTGFTNIDFNVGSV